VSLSAAGLVLGLLVSTDTPLFSGGGRLPVNIGPVPAKLASTRAESCGTCHTAITAEWRQSRHADAWTNTLFQSAYAIEPLAQCRNCHAPTNGGRFPAGLAAADGVTCSVCHVRGGKVLGAMGTGHAAHAGRVEPSLQTAAFCAGCHQFGFFSREGGRHVETDEPQQNTVAEWQRSSAARQGIECVDCHMPLVGDAGARHRSHSFLGGRDLALLRSAVTVTVTARRDGPDVVVSATVSPAATGHSFPTGDLFRRVELVVTAGEATHTFVYARRFQDRFEAAAGGGMVRRRRQVEDSRVPPPGTGVISPRSARLRADGAAEVRWHLDYLIMPSTDAAASGGEPVTRTRLFDGVAPLSTPPTSAPGDDR
jgi:hypothetical protein